MQLTLKMYWTISFITSCNIMMTKIFRFKVISLLEAPSEDSYKDLLACPSAYFPSDHFRIEAVLEF